MTRKLQDLERMKNNNLSARLILGHIILLGLTLNVFAAPAPIITSTLDHSDKQENKFGIGFTGSVAERPFVGVDNQSASLLYLSYKNDFFYIEGLDIGFNVYKNKTSSLDILATPRFYEVKESFASNGELNGIDETKPSYFGGVSSQIRTRLFTYTFQILHDLIESDGNEFVAQGSKSFNISNDFILTPSVGFVYQDKKLVDYFYGVQTNEVIAGRPQYTGKGSLNYNITLNANWSATKHIDILGQVKYEKLGNGIIDSPITNKDTVLFLTLGAVYRF